MRNIILKGLNIGFLLEKTAKNSLTVTTIREDKLEEYVERELVFQDEDIGKFNVLYLQPINNSESPVIMGLHGHHDSNKTFRDEYLGKELVKKGFSVIMPWFRAMNADEEESKITNHLYSKGFSLMGLRVYETILIIKYLKFLGKDKIGILSHSGGSSTANLLVRISGKIDAQVTDMNCNYLDVAYNEFVHCETIPEINKLYVAINNASSLPIPYCKVSYGFKKFVPHGFDEKTKIVQFFNTYLK